MTTIKIKNNAYSVDDIIKLISFPIIALSLMKMIPGTGVKTNFQLGYVLFGSAIFLHYRRIEKVFYPLIAMFIYGALVAVFQEQASYFNIALRCIQIFSLTSIATYISEHYSRKDFSTLFYSIFNLSSFRSLPRTCQWHLYSRENFIWIQKEDLCC